MINNNSYILDRYFIICEVDFGIYVCYVWFKSKRE